MEGSIGNDQSLMFFMVTLLALTPAIPLRDVCGWPSLYTGGLFGPPTVRLAQRMLGFVLNESIVADGNFTSATVASIKKFQEIAGINASTPGRLSAGTWPALVDACVNSSLAKSSLLTLALQDALTFNGFTTPLTGHLDDQTVQALSKFQRQRGAARQPPGSVDASTWHLLATGCRSGIDGGAFWFDAGWPQGSLDVSTLSCLHAHGFEFGTFECWVEQSRSASQPHHQGSFWSECPRNVANARQAGFASVGVYMFPGRNGDPVAQTKWLLGNLSAHSVTFDAVMLDVEGDDWLQHTHEENRAFMLSIKGVLDAAHVPYTVYSGRLWPSFFGDGFTAFQDAPLIYAHYDAVPSLYDFIASPKYGGWSQAAGKQFWDGQGVEYQLCGTGPLDWDWSPQPFWSTWNADSPS
jgi:hypothetical protein